MKRFVFLLMLVCLTLVLVACVNPSITTEAPDQTNAPNTTVPVTTVPATTAVITTVPTVPFVENGKPLFQILASEDVLEENADFLAAYAELFVAEGIEKPAVLKDTVAAKDFEILLGATVRDVTLKEVENYEYSITLQGNKLVVAANNTYGYEQALNYLYTHYVKDRESTMAIPEGLSYDGTLDLTYSDALKMPYADVKMSVWDSFNAAYWKSMWVPGHAYWDTAEMLEVYVDAYEQSRDEAIKAKMLDYAKVFTMSYQKNWAYNDYNDDIMWACIAFCRITLLTGDKSYYEVAKTNFATVWERGYDDELGGGLYWKMKEPVMSKNSCVNCPGAIAACLLGEISGEEDYFQKAKSLMEWELENMFEPDTGRVYDSLNVEGKLNKWASTYNQGTFVGACTLLYQHYGDQAWLNYAKSAVSYAMANLDDGDSGVLSGESNGNDLPGFKGILTRWFYRYAKETGDIEVLLFLQHNADVAYSNRNDNGLIWTKWNEKTPNNLSGYITFGQSTALALVFNCQPWWETTN